MAAVNIDIDSKFNSQGIVAAKDAVGNLNTVVGRSANVIKSLSSELGAAGGAAGKFGGMLGKVGGLVQTALMGPVGIATAAVTGLVAVISKMVEKHNAAAKAAREHADALKKLSDEADALAAKNEFEEGAIYSADPAAARRSQSYDAKQSEKAKLQAEIDALAAERARFTQSDEYKSGSTAALTKRAELTEKIRVAEEKMRSIQIEQVKLMQEQAAEDEKRAEAEAKRTAEIEKQVEAELKKQKADEMAKAERDFAFDQAMAQAASDFDEKLGAADRAEADRKALEDWKKRVNLGLEGANALGDKDFKEAWKSLDPNKVGDREELAQMEEALKKAIEDNTAKTQALSDEYARSRETTERYLEARDAGMAAEMANDWTPTDYDMQNGGIVSKSQAQRAWRRGTVGAEANRARENNRRMNDEYFKDVAELAELQRKMEEGAGGLSPGDQQKMDFLKGRLGELQQALGMDEESSVDDHIRNQTRNLIKILNRLNGMDPADCKPQTIA